MVSNPESARRGSSGAEPLSGATLYLFGRVHGVPRRRLERLVAARGGKLVAKPGARINLIAVAHSAASKVLPDGRLTLPAGLPVMADMLGEFELRRRLGLRPPPEAVDRSLGSADLERLASLTKAQVSCLALFDVIEPVEGRYAYRDLVAAREAGRLMARGIELGRVIEASMALRRRGNHLADTKLTEGVAGALMRDLGGQMAELSGQLTMGLGRGARSVDDLVAAAEAAEEADDLMAAENLYTTALRADPNDPVLAFNLGNILDAQGRRAEAKIAWQSAVARDPGLAEAWYNLALAAEDAAHHEPAIAQYRRALQAQPDYVDAAFNLALLLTKLERCGEALTYWDRLLDAQVSPAQAATARKAAALCRMRIKQAEAKAG